ncbi:hypothetical protein [Mycolicibacterium baixiangningiae]|uniref:hypothetical protein n=1 Tax=Mycolicibacterium baixiangningiae TaxID=2761578 RepID=UPI001D0291E2|nr:hypothetical protein [Mycolicibacterium baixiangningiae]
MLLVVALAVTMTILVTRDGSDGNSPTPPGDGQASEFASANDTGPVNIITEDPTCPAWGIVSRELAVTASRLDWVNRNDAVPRAAWGPEQRQQYESVAEAITLAAGKAANLMRSTPNRVMREMYEQFIAYSRSFTGSLQNYEPKHNRLAVVLENLSSGLSTVCSAISYDVSRAFAPLLPTVPAPSEVAPPADMSAPTMFLQSPNSSCPEWDSEAMKFADESADWRGVNTKIPASEWTPVERATVESATPRMSALADTMQRLGSGSGNPVFEDFAFLATQYWRAFVMAVPEYHSADNYLSASATYLTNIVLVACEVVT